MPKNFKQVIEHWNSDPFLSNLRIPNEVSIRTAKAFQVRELAIYHHATETEDAYLEITDKGEDFILNQK